MFCQKTGYGGAPKTEKVDYKEKAKPVASRPLTIRFNADVAGAAAAAAAAAAAFNHPFARLSRLDIPPLPKADEGGRR